MKKIIALALALIMALSMGVVAFAAAYTEPAYTTNAAPGAEIVLCTWTADTGAIKAANKVSYDFTKGTNTGASLVESVKITKDNKLVLTLKEHYKMTDAKELIGSVTLTEKASGDTYTFPVDIDVNNASATIFGSKKAAEAPVINPLIEDKVLVMDEDGGYVKFIDGVLTGVVKMDKEEKIQIFADVIDDDTRDAIDAYLGEDYEAIVEEYVYAGTGFNNEVAFTYEAEEEDPHFFYAWDGEKFVDLEGKYNDDEEVEAYEFTGNAKGIIIVTDVEIVAAAEETKNPDTGANDVVGVAAALAVVSLVAAGAVSLKK